MELLEPFATNTRGTACEGAGARGAAASMRREKPSMSKKNGKLPADRGGTGSGEPKRNATNSCSAEPGGRSVHNEVVDVRTLRPHPHNSFDMDPGELERLADNIAQVGLLHAPFARRVDDGGLQVVSGHRRVRALQLLAEKDPAYREIEVRVAENMSDLEALVALHSGNLTSRHLSAAEREEQTELLKRRCDDMRIAEPERYRGMRTDEMIAGILGVTYSSYRRAAKIARDLEPEAAELLDAGKISTALAVELSSQAPEVQRAFAARAERAGVADNRQAKALWRDMTEGPAKRVERFEAALREANSELFKLRDSLASAAAAEVPTWMLCKLKRDLGKMRRAVDELLAEAEAGGADAE